MPTSSALAFLILIAGFLGTLCDVMTTDNHNITYTEPESVKLLYGESHGISWTDLSISHRLPPLLTHNFLEVFSVDYHYMRNLIFYTGWNSIWRLPMDEAGSDGQGEQEVGVAAGATTLAVDWEHDRLYWTNPASETVWRADLDDLLETDVEIIRNPGNMTSHNNVVVDPYARFLFVATESGYTLRSDLDGDHRVTIDHGLRSTALALDIHTRTLYVCGSRDFVPVILSSDYAGESVVDYKLNYGGEWWVNLVGIDVISIRQPRQLFWVHHGWRDRDTAWRANISDSALSWEKEYTVSGTVLDPENRIWCVKVFHPDVQSRPKYLESEGSQSCSSEYLTDTVDQGPGIAVSSGAASTLQTTSLLLHTLNCIILAMICRP